MKNAYDGPMIVLLHGAGTGEWIWERVRPLLPQPNLALEMPGRDEDVTPDGCAARVVSAVDKAHHGSVAFVLHSLAAVLAAPLVARLGARLRRIIFVAGVIPPRGGSFVDALPLMNRVMLRVLFRMHREGLKPSAAMVERELCNDLSAADTRMVVDRYQAERPGLYLSRGPAIELPSHCTYVKLLKDQCVPPRLQDRMISRLTGPTVRELSTGHLPMLAAPEALAMVIGQDIKAIDTAPEASDTSVS